MNKIIVILGPTASGKTAASIRLSTMIGINVISADSRQIYKFLDIGTAKPDKSELDAVQHHFIDIIEPDKYYSAGLFGDEAEKVAVDIINSGKVPVVVGGSGLYIQSLCQGFFQETDIDSEKRNSVRQKLDDRLKSNGIQVLYEELLSVDPVSAARYSDQNPRRIIRALEYFYLTGKQLSLAQEQKPVARPFEPIYFGIHFERSKLYDRINKRAEIMWNSGLIDETNNVLQMGYSENLNSLNTVGYKEAIAFLKGKMSEEDALAKMQQNTRRYAKRQMTWFRGIESITWLSGNELEIAEKIYEAINQDQ